MAKKWLDSIEKQKKEKAMFVTNRQTDTHTDPDPRQLGDWTVNDCQRQATVNDKK